MGGKLFHFKGFAANEALLMVFIYFKLIQKLLNNIFCCTFFDTQL